MSDVTDQLDEVTIADGGSDETDSGGEATLDRSAGAVVGAPDGAAIPIEIDLTTDPPRVIAVPATPPPQQVFAGAARFRPVVVSLVIAAAIVVGYGVVVLSSVLIDGISPDTSPFDGAPPDRTVVASRGSFVEPGRCATVAGRVFIDGDGNAIADPWDPPHDYAGIEVLVETDSGVLRRIPVENDGSWSLPLGAPATAQVTVVGLADLAVDGLWPGPRLLDEAGEAPIIGDTCRLDLGLIWSPVGAAPPRVGAIGGLVAAPVPVDDAAAEASGWRAGIQIHGRVWRDLDGDGRRGPAEPGVAGATIALYRDDGALAATATTGTDGAYAVANLRPGAIYVGVVTADETVSTVRAMGRPVFTDDPASVEIATSAAGVSVWGLDFGVGGSPAVAPPAPVSVGDDLGDARRRDRNGS